MRKGWLIVSSTVNDYKKQRYLAEAKRQGLPLVIVGADELALVLDGNKQLVYYQGKQLKQYPDFVLSLVISEKLHPHLIRVLELLEKETFVCNSVSGYRMANDKAATYQLLSELDVSYPKTVLVGAENQRFSQLKSVVGSPFLVKPNSNYRGQGIEVIKSEQEWTNYLDQPDLGFFLVQEFLAASKGTDLRLLVLGKQILGAVKRSAVDGGFLSNSFQGSSAEVVKPSAAQKAIAVKVASTMSLDFCSVDFIFNGQEYVVCEVNAGPGFEQFEQTTGVNVAGQVLQYLDKQAGVVQR